MIVQKYFEINSREYVYTKSDDGRYIERDGMMFEDAYDPAEFGRTYTEGGVIEHSPEDIEIIEILLGGDSE